jgi:hypothetical protein
MGGWHRAILGLIGLGVGYGVYRVGRDRGERAIALVACEACTNQIAAGRALPAGQSQTEDALVAIARRQLAGLPRMMTTVGRRR